MVPNDVLDQLRGDPGQRTLGELLQERGAAAQEITRLRSETDQLKAKIEARRVQAAGVRDEAQDSASAVCADALIRISDLCAMIGVSRSTIYRWVSEGTFPSPVRISNHAIRWRMDEIAVWRNGLRRP